MQFLQIFSLFGWFFKNVLSYKLCLDNYKNNKKKADVVSEISGHKESNFTFILYYCRWPKCINTIELTYILRDHRYQYDIGNVDVKVYWSIQIDNQ